MPMYAMGIYQYKKVQGCQLRVKNYITFNLFYLYFRENLKDLQKLIKKQDERYEQIGQGNELK
jgi:hypothetical protein